MTKPETRYQKYLARKRQKQEKKTTQTKPGNAGSMASQIALAGKAPIHECLVPANLFERGIGNLVFSRSLPDGRMALAMFLLDVFCLGVKNTFFAIVARDEYDRRLRSWREAESLQRIDPACLRKLVEGGVVYARELGFNPPCRLCRSAPDLRRRGGRSLSISFRVWACGQALLYFRSP